MDVEFVQKLQSRPLSPARRLFVLEEMTGRTTDEHDDELRERIRRIIEIDRDNVRRATELHCSEPGPHRLSEVLGIVDADDDRSRAHREFIALIVYILRTYEPGLRRPLLAPARRQTNRLDQMRPGSGASPALSTEEPETGRFRQPSS